MPRASRIDTHHHFCPSDYRKAVRAKPPLQSVLLDWTPEKSLQDIDRAGVAVAVHSVTTRRLWFGGAGEARRLVRLSNEYGAVDCI